MLNISRAYISVNRLNERDRPLLSSCVYSQMSIMKYFQSVSQIQNLQATGEGLPSPSTSLFVESSGDKQCSGEETGDHLECAEPSPKQPCIESVS